MAKPTERELSSLPTEPRARIPRTTDNLPAIAAMRKRYDTAGLQVADPAQARDGSAVRDGGAAPTPIPIVE